MKAALPKNEQERLQELESFKILDTFTEKDYDDLVLLASQIAQTPISLLSLIDEERQWFKAKVGLGVNETSREYAFCAHSILTPGMPMIIHDSHEDERFVDNPLVTSDPKIRFYAGFPLVTGENCALGTLCVIDSVPRQLTEEQLSSLEIIAKQVVMQLKLRKAYNELSILSKKLTSLNKFRDQIFETSAQELGLPTIEMKLVVDKLLKDGAVMNNPHLLKEINYIASYCDKLSTNIKQFQSLEKIYDPA